jgi:hypothetical protein
MSNQQGDKPPSAAPAGAYGPGHTVLGEPAFVEENAPAAFPPQAMPAAPHAGAAVPATVFDASAFVPPPEYPVSPYAGNTAPAAGYGPAPGYGPAAYGMPGGPPPPMAGYTAPAPNPYGGPPPAYPAPPQRSAPRAAAGPPLLIIGLAAFAVIGGLTTFLALRGRSSSEDNDKPIPTIDVPPMATVPSDPGPGAAGADPTEPPPAVPVAPPTAVAPTPVAPKPTATTPKPIATSTTPVPTVTTRPTSTTTAPTPTSTTKPKGPVLVPRRPIPKR